MSWLTSFLKSSVGRKLLMSLTGLFLTLFLCIHLLGNLALLFPDGQAFNEYADFMGKNPLIQIISWSNLAFILIHVIDGISLSISNRNARKSRYAVNNTNSHWTSRNMLIFGAVLFLFIIIHLSNFWFVKKFGTMPTVNYGGAELKDLYKVVHAKFQNPLYVAFYAGSMLFIAFHLWHGFQSAFQTVGFNSKKYTPIVKKIGYGLALVLTLGFAFIPIYIFFAY